LIEAMAKDSVVAGHYAGIDKANLKIGRLSEPLQAHVSYRIGDRVYWTKRKLTIQAGEQIVTDGKTLVRGRCGNNISVAPLLPTLDNEPKPDVFDSIVAPLAPNTLVQLDPAHSYFTPQDLKTPQGPGWQSAVRQLGRRLCGTASSRKWRHAGHALDPVGRSDTQRFSAGRQSTWTVRVRRGDQFKRRRPTCRRLRRQSPGGDPKGDPKGDPPSDPPTDFTPRDVPNTLTAVPEPGTLFLVAGGAAALLAHRIRRKAR
jgi:hypothetical protein